MLAAGAPPGEEWRWFAFFFILFYVDDGGLACFDDLLYDHHGQPVLEIVLDKDGRQMRDHNQALVLRHQRRPSMYADAAKKLSRRWGHDTPWKKFVSETLFLVYLGVGIDVKRQLRLLSHDKRVTYSHDVDLVTQSDKRAPNGVLVYFRDHVDSLVHKLTHASDVIPLGRQHLYHLRQALKNPISFEHTSMVIISTKCLRELEWWKHNLAKSDDHGLPLASRSEFPSVGDDDHVIEYHDASREIGNIQSSGWGAWTIIKDVFYYIVGRWSTDEINEYSINVLESKVRDMAIFTFVVHARKLGLAATHATSFSDNATAEMNAEFGRPGTELLNKMLATRQREAANLSLHIMNDRVASIDNDIADLLSRGDVGEALRFPRSANVRAVELQVDPVWRQF